MHYEPSEDPSKVDGLVEIDGKLLARYSPWHFDHCYNDELIVLGSCARLSSRRWAAEQDSWTA